MCLGMPGQVIELRGTIALVDFWGVRRSINIEELEEPIITGDYIVSHAGSAVRRIPDTEVADTLGLYAIVLAEAGDDPIVRDPVRELEQSSDAPAAIM